MKIKHEHIRMAMNAWAHPDGEKSTGQNYQSVFRNWQMTFPELYDDSHPEALARNTQKIFRWVDKDTPMRLKKFRRCYLLSKKQCRLCWWPECASDSSAYFRELVETRERLVRDADDFVAVAIAGFNQMNRGGPAGNAVVMH